MIERSRFCGFCVARIVSTPVYERTSAVSRYKSFRLPNDFSKCVQHKSIGACTGQTALMSKRRLRRGYPQNSGVSRSLDSVREQPCPRTRTETTTTMMMMMMMPMSWLSHPPDRPPGRRHRKRPHRQNFRSVPACLGTSACPGRCCTASQPPALEPGT